MGGVGAFPSGKDGSPSLLLLAKIDRHCFSFLGFHDDARRRSCIFVLVLRDNIFMDFSPALQIVINHWLTTV